LTPLDRSRVIEHDGGRSAPVRGKSRSGAAFEEADSDLFFGREAIIATLEAKLKAHPITAVVGTSGLGKSSVVLAGLVSRLREKDWRIAACRTIGNPLRELVLIRAGPRPAFDASNDVRDHAELEPFVELPTSVAGQIRCEPRSRWPSSRRRPEST
jgi:Novel STAND NTPase 1